MLDYAECCLYSQVSFVVVCSPVCLNGGECVRPNECNCATGYTGAVCNTGKFNNRGKYLHLVF